MAHCEDVSASCNMDLHWDKSSYSMEVKKKVADKLENN